MKKIITLVLAACMMLTSFCALAESDKYTIVVMPKQVGITYFESARAGVVKAGEELGVNAVFTGPTVADAAEQVKMIQDLISQGVNAIAVSANDADALTPVLTQARNAGIVILDWDTPADPSVVDLSVQTVEFKRFGEANLDELVRQMGTDEGEYAILTSTLTAGTCNEWINAVLAYAAEKYPNLTLVCDPVCTNESIDEAYSKTLDLLTTYPDLKGIIGFSSPAPIGAGQAVSEGAISSGLLWDPAALGYLSVGLAKYVLDGNEIKDGDVEIEGYGTATIVGKQVFMGDPLIFTAETVDNYNF